MRRVVLVAYYYPPVGGAAANRALGFARHLPAHGWAVTVVTPGEATFGRDPSLPTTLPPPGRVIRCLSPEPAAWLRRGAGGAGGTGIVEEAALGRRGSRLRAWAREWVYVPDAQAPWIPFAALAAIRASRGADLILSSGPPLSAHVAAMLAARATGVPWVADVRDLWTPRRGTETARARLDARMETALLRRADAITTISESFVGLLARMLGRPASDVAGIPNGFDADDYVEAERRVPERFTLTFTGLTHGDRQDLSVFLGVLWGLVDAGRIDRERFRLRLVGRLDARTRGLVERSGLGDLVVEEGFRPHAEAVRAQRDATALLLLVWSAEDDVRTGVRPAKLPEYLGAGRPVLALGDPEDEAARVLAEAGAGRTVRFDDAEGIAAALADLYGRWEREGDLPRAVSPETAAPHARSARAADLARFLARLTAGTSVTSGRPSAS